MNVCDVSVCVHVCNISTHICDMCVSVHAYMHMCIDVIYACDKSVYTCKSLCICTHIFDVGMYNACL